MSQSGPSGSPQRRPATNKGIPQRRVSAPKHLHPEPIYRHVAAKIRKTRRALGLCQEDVAAGLGVRRQTYQRVETGQCGISLCNILRIAAFLNVHYLTLLEGYVPGGQIHATTKPAVPRFDVSDPVQMGADPMAPQAPDTTPLDDEPSYLVIDH
jgi:DNA-binding XRE family transcriptional regulator